MDAPSPSPPLLARGIGTLLPPWLRRFVWRSFYGLLARVSRRGVEEFACMNWGYNDPEAGFPGDLGVRSFKCGERIYFLMQLRRRAPAAG